MQVVMVRSIFGKWKQTIYFDFGVDMKPPLFNEIVAKVEETGFKVSGVVCDLGGQNRSLRNKLNITTEKPFCQNPVDPQRRIHFFADAPHMIKLLRNHFLDFGFIVNGKLVNKEPIQDLLEKDNGEIRKCFKIGSKHLKVQNQDRMKVSTAVQLLSHSVATGIRKFCSSDFKFVADFIDTVNDYFDIFNSFGPTYQSKIKAPYGMNLAEQNIALDKMYELCQNMRTPPGPKTKGSKDPLPFQLGILSSIRALRNMYITDLRGRLQIRYIITRRLNQDCLENLFSQLRSKGGAYDHPTPISALYRIRMLILGRDPGIVTDTTSLNTIDSVDCPPPDSRINDEESVSIATMLFNSVPENQLDPSAVNDTSSIKRTRDGYDEGLEFVAGWTAFTYKNKYPELSLEKSVVSEIISSSNWTRMLSNSAGLTHPSNFWMTIAEKMEELFNVKCGASVSYEPGIVKSLCCSVQKSFPGFEIPIKPLKTLVRLRVFIRIRTINAKSKEPFEGERKGRKKMKKIIT
jgi:hypothetical protein